MSANLVSILFNPAANRGRAAARWRRLCEPLSDVCRRHGCALQVLPTSAESAARTLAAQAAERGCRLLVAVGGDGTVHEAANGLLSSSRPDTPLAVAPLGTGNDFAFALRLPSDPSRVVEAFLAGEASPTPVDVGQVDGAWFVNNAAVAMEPEVTLESRRLRWLRGSLRYLVALLRTLRRLRAWNLRVTWEEGDFSGPAYLLSVCNGPRSGGLFPMAPGARVDDGWLDFVLVPQIGNLAVTEVLWRLLRGRHREHPAVLSGRSRWLRVTSEPATALHADGEMRPGLRGEVRFEIGGRKLRVLGRNFCG